jgi:hypothetical protein
MDYPEYADKYDAPYPDEHWEKWKRMGKQMADARYVAEETGWYGSLGGGVNEDAAAFLASAGCVVFPTSWSETRLGLGGAVASAPGGLFGGVEGGLRLHTPTRVAPFVGCGGYIGATDVAGDEDDLWDDDDDANGIGAVYPEVGTHFWLNGSTRVSLSASRWFTTMDGDHDLWVFSLSLTGI